MRYFPSSLSLTYSMRLTTLGRELLASDVVSSLNSSKSSQAIDFTFNVGLILKANAEPTAIAS